MRSVVGLAPVAWARTQIGRPATWARPGTVTAVPMPASAFETTRVPCTITAPAGVKRTLARYSFVPAWRSAM